MKAEQLEEAKILGAHAYHGGLKCVPYLDKEIMRMLDGRKVGETPEGEASTIEIMQAWSKGWVIENLSFEII